MGALNLIISRAILGIATLALLSACGGGGSSNNDKRSETSSNVALISAGASISSTFSGNETFVIDGDLDTESFWQAGTEGDSITITLSKSYSVESFDIRSVNLKSNTDFKLEISDDGTNYTSIDIISDCLNFSLGASGYSCDLKEAKNSQAVRLTILKKADIIEIYEVEVMGK